MLYFMTKWLKIYESFYHSKLGKKIMLDGDSSQPIPVTAIIKKLSL